MEIDEALSTYLLSVTGLTKLIDRRLYPEETPQGVDLKKQSAVTYIFISDEKNHTHQGQSTAENPNIQFTVHAPTRAIARTISNQIKSALCDYSGTMSGLTISYITLINEIPSMQKTKDGIVSVHTMDLEFEVDFIKE